MSAQAQPSARAATSFTPFDPLSVPLERTQFVEASAGTGKTYSITLLYLRCLLEKRLAPNAILVVTFTRAATAELRDRIRRGIVDARTHLEADEAGRESTDETLRTYLATYIDEGREDALRLLSEALDSLDRASIFTIDGFCSRVLAQYAFEGGVAFESELITDANPIVESIAFDRWVSRFGNATPKDFAQNPYRAPGSVVSLLLAGVSNRTATLAPAKVSDDELEARQARFERASSVYIAARANGGDDASVLADAKRVRTRISTVDALSACDAIASGAVPPSSQRPKNWEYVSATELRAFDKKGKYVAHPIFDAVDALLDAGGPLHAATLGRDSAEFMSAGLAAYDAQTVSRGRLTFANVKSTLQALLTAPTSGAVLGRALAETYRVALIDECQDTDIGQFEIFQAIFAANERPSLFIGDPKQAIYRFRGADIHAYLIARDAASARYTMEANFRSRPELIGSLNTLYGEQTTPFGDIPVDYTPVKAGFAESALAKLDDDVARGAFEALYVTHKGDPLGCIAADIVRGLGTANITRPKSGVGPLRPRDIAVLTRSNRDVEMICRALRSRGVPAVAASNRSVFSSQEAGWLVFFLHAVLDPAKVRAVRAALLTPLFGVSPRQLHALANDDSAWNAQIAALREMRRDFEENGVGYVYARFCRETALEARLLRRPDGFRVVTNLQHVIELAVRAASEKRLRPDGILAWLERACAGDDDEEASSSDERGLRLEHSGDAVSVLTVHKSKGLEYDVVYVFGLAKSGKGGLSSPMLVNAPNGPVIVTDFSAAPEFEAIATTEQAEETARLVYVALTRAKLAVRVVWEATHPIKSARGMPCTPLGRLLTGDDPPLVEGVYADGDVLHQHLVDRLAALSEKHGASVGARKLTNDRATYVPRVPMPELHPAVPTVRTFVSAARTTSFSGLVSSADHARPKDRDGSATGAASLSIADPLAGAPAGARLGVLVHEVLEQVDFDAAPDVIASVVAKATERATAFAQHASAITATVERVLATPLLADGTCLAKLSRAQTLRELEFHLPVRSRGSFTPAALGALFTDHAVPAAGSGYGEAIGALAFDALDGFLHGFVDLIFESEGRFYVVDYKSNRLGGADAYRAGALVEPMTTNHYVLQYALYTLALHRLLQRRLPGYDYEQHIGGALYLFVRGMSPESSVESGVFSARLPLAFIAGLDALLAGAHA